MVQNIRGATAIGPQPTLLQVPADRENPYGSTTLTSLMYQLSRIHRHTEYRMHNMVYVSTRSSNRVLGYSGTRYMDYSIAAVILKSPEIKKNKNMVQNSRGATAIGPQPKLLQLRAERALMDRLH